MHHNEFISQLDEQRIVEAIGLAEKQSSGEIRVYVSHKERHDALAFAKKRFVELGMTRTRQRNAVLIYFVPRTRQFAVLGDIGIHEKCGDEFWKAIVREMAVKMKAGQFSDAIITAIQQIAAVLAQHFPPQPGDENQLSDSIVRD